MAKYTLKQIEHHKAILKRSIMDGKTRNIRLNKLINIT